MIERQIITGLIVSEQFIQQVLPIWDVKLLESRTAQRIAIWVMDYFNEYNMAPGKTIQDIYDQKLHNGELPEDLAEDIEDILQGLSEEYDEKFNLQYILDRTNSYFKERHLQNHNEKVKELLEQDDVEGANALALAYKGLSSGVSNDLDLSNTNALLKIENAFMELSQPLIVYPGPLGDLWNSQLVRGSLVGILAPEKRGKTFLLLDMCVRGVRQKAKVAFFQAGDMTENQQIKRIGSYLSKKPIQEKYCGDVYFPVIDCLRNQLDTCSKEERECDFGPFADQKKWDEKTLRKEITIEALKEAYEDDGEDYKTCRNCKEFQARSLGTPWLQKTHIKSPIRVNEAKRKVQEFFIDKKRRLRVSTHANGTLSIRKIEQILDRWEREDDFVADIIAIDYADILIDEVQKEERHKQNQIWKDARGLSQTRNALVILPTQADAKSYETHTLKLSNFSEDKRKYGHCTAFFGLNQDKNGREKKIGLLRINELIAREGRFDAASTVTVLQSLDQGRPFIGSYK